MCHRTVAPRIFRQALRLHPLPLLLPRVSPSMAQPVAEMELYGREFCPSCGFWSDHLWYPESTMRNKNKEVISVWVRCGWSGCQLDREERINR